MYFELSNKRKYQIKTLSLALSKIEIKMLTVCRKFKKKLPKKNNNNISPPAPCSIPKSQTNLFAKEKFIEIPVLWKYFLLLAIVIRNFIMFGNLSNKYNNCAARTVFIHMRMKPITLPWHTTTTTRSQLFFFFYIYD